MRTDLTCEPRRPGLERAHHMRDTQEYTVSAQIYTSHGTITPAANQGAPSTGDMNGFFKKCRQSGRIQIADILFLEVVSRRYTSTPAETARGRLQENRDQFPS